MGQADPGDGSYESGDTMNISIKDMIAQKVCEYPERIILKADEAEYTWRDVDRGASAIAAELYTLGAGPGSQVALIRRKFHCHCCHRLVYYYIGGYRGGTEWIKI